MGNRQHRDVPLQSDEYDLIGEVVHGKASHVRIRNTGNERAGSGKLLEMSQRLPDFRCKSFGNLVTPFAIPTGCLSQLASSLTPQVYTSQRDRTSR